MTRTHAPHPDPTVAAEPLSMSLCGRSGTSHSAEREVVTCKPCTRLLDRSAALVAETVHAVFTPTAPIPLVLGARELTSTGRRAIARVLIERDAPKRIWSSVDAAVKAWVRMRDEGASLVGTCHPSRADRVQTSRGMVHGGREHDAIERTATVGRALRDATERVVHLNIACPLIEADRCEQIYLLSVAGKEVLVPIRRGSETLKQKCWIRRSYSVQMVADCAAMEYRALVNWRHVEAIRDHYVEFIADALVASGEMRAHRARGPRRGSFAAGPAARVGT